MLRQRREREEEEDGPGVPPQNPRNGGMPAREGKVGDGALRRKGTTGGTGPRSGVRKLVDESDARRSKEIGEAEVRKRQAEKEAERKVAAARKAGEDSLKSSKDEGAASNAGGGDDWGVICGGYTVNSAESRRSAPSATFSRYYAKHAGLQASIRAGEEDESGKGVGCYNPLFHYATTSGGEKAPVGSPRTARRTHFLEFNPKVLEGFMRVDMRGFLTNPAPQKGGTLKCFIRRNKNELFRGSSKLIRGQEVYSLYMEGKGDFPHRYLMTGRKKGGAAASQFVITMGESEDSEESDVVGRLQATSRTSEAFQIFSPVVSRSQEAQGVICEKEIAAVHYPADAMETHGRYDGPRRMRVILGSTHGSNSHAANKNSLLHRMLKGSLDAVEEPCLVNKNPRWNAQVQAFVLNFHGRVTQASVKNFQLVVQGEILQQIALQFGRTRTNEFTMDFCHPLSPLQAFAIALTSFDCK